MINPLRLIRKRRRKYPIQYDDEGRSIRSRCREAFDQGQRPAQVIKGYGFKPNTVNDYWKQWKKLKPGFHQRYEEAKEMRKNAPGFIAAAIPAVAKTFDLSEFEVTCRLEQPWGLKRLLDGSWANDRRDPVRAEATAKLSKLTAHLIIYDMKNHPPEKIVEVLKGIGVEFRDAPPPEDAVSQDILDQLDKVIDEEAQTD